MTNSPGAAPYIYSGRCVLCVTCILAWGCDVRSHTPSPDAMLYRLHCITRGRVHGGGAIEQKDNTGNTCIRSSAACLLPNQ